MVVCGLFVATERAKRREERTKGTQKQASVLNKMVPLSSAGRKRLAVNKKRGSGKKSSWSIRKCVGLSMVLILFGYMMVVMMFAQHHYPRRYNNARRRETSVIRQRWESIKEARNLTDASSTKQKRNPLRIHHLENPLNHQVAPDILLHAQESVTAVKVDPPHHPTPDRVLTAYLEPLNFDDWKVKPLPIRQTTAQELKKIQYKRLQSCQHLPQQFPIDDPPTDHDSFLPWIHDVFPSPDGTYIQIVAQNKRRCKNGSKEKHILHQQQPQASLFQHVPVKRVTINDETRYQLTNHSQADADAVATRFICKFQPDGTETLSRFNFDYDWISYRKKYKVSFKEDDAGIKQIHTSQLMFQCPVPKHLVDTIRTGESVQNDWASLFLDLIPIRTPPRFGRPIRFLQPIYKEFETTDKDDVFDPEFEWGNSHVLPKVQDSGRWENIPICKPSLMTYGNEASKEQAATHAASSATTPDTATAVEKRHKLVSCMWASAGYTTRGNRFAINDGQRRLLEWITFNKLLGFDHFFLYDNSVSDKLFLANNFKKSLTLLLALTLFIQGAFGNGTSLKAIADLFPDDVTYIPWPAQICNNNPNNVDSVGERSSQYAAEASCLLRFGPHVDWIGQFDMDEYFVPQGEYRTAVDLLNDLEKEDTRIVTFGSWRAWPRRAFIEPPEKIEDPDVCWSNEPCFNLKIPYDQTMLQSYNCDRQKPGQKKSSMPAEKGFYRSDYVLQHFVHYSSVTVQSLKNQTEYLKDGFRWKPRAFPDPRQRFGNELTEGLMIHTKAVARQDTAGWERMCHIRNMKLPKRQQGLCRLGVPFPDDWNGSVNATKEGWAFNCYPNALVEEYFAPRLKEALSEHAHVF